MKKLSTISTLTIILALVVLSSAACGSMHARLDRKLNGPNPYLKAPFYMRYVANDNALDRNITRVVNALRDDPSNAALHNDLGALLLEKSFPNDAELEFRRAVDNDPKLYAAWYNLGLIRETEGDLGGAERALQKTLDLKPGHSAAQFQLGLIDEMKGRNDAAIEHYARAFRINRSLLDIHVNPRILDTRLADRALLRSYELDHAEAGAQFQSTPSGYTSPGRRGSETPNNGTTDAAPLEAPSKQPDPVSIVSPAPSAGDLTLQAARPAPATTPTPIRSRSSSPPSTSPGTTAPGPRHSPPLNGQPPVFTLRPDATGGAHLP